MPAPNKKIQTLHIQNFKFFGTTEPISIGNKHVLLYGENGSGKSSIYTALRELLNSASRNSSTIKRRLNRNEAKNLVNIHAPFDAVTGDADTFVEVIFE